MRYPVAIVVAILAVLFAACEPASAQFATADHRPNIILIMADDMGFSDLGCFGSEIRTPHLNRLAQNGLKFTQFYNAARCCPTRAALMTGLYPHQTGVGHMMNDYGRPGYRGTLNRDCATIAQILQKAGYQTMMTGKWHLTRHVGANDPKQAWPLQRGFEKFYGTIHGGGSYFDPVTLTRGNHPQRRPPGMYYYTDAVSDQAADYVREAARAKNPFFLYVAYTSPHWPLHAPADVIAQYRAQYAIGWDQLRENRHRKMVQLGIVKRDWPLTPRDSRVGPWTQNAFKPWQQRRMEVYAAQVDAMDRGIGHIMESVRQAGVERNTLVMFLADNGGCAEEITPSWKGLHIPEKTFAGSLVQVGNDPKTMPGPEETYQSYGIAWANASNTPFRLYKHWVHEGGISTPLIVSWPEGISIRGKLIHDVGHVTDILPTCLQVAKTGYPKSLRGFPLTPPEGQSLLPIFQGKTRQRKPIFWEHEGNRAVRDGKWKLVSRHPGDWELYDMQADRTELNNLADRFPVIVNDLSAAYEAWAKRCNVEPWRR